MITFLYIPELFGISIEVYFILFIIAIPTFLFWKWLLKKYIKPIKERKIATWFATIIITPILYVGLIILFIFLSTYTPNEDFDKSNWLTLREGRFQMVNEIIKSKMLIGNDTNQLKQKLGEPYLERQYPMDLRYGYGGRHLWNFLS